MSCSEVVESLVLEVREFYVEVEFSTSRGEVEIGTIYINGEESDIDTLIVLMAWDDL